MHPLALSVWVLRPVYQTVVAGTVCCRHPVTVISVAVMAMPAKVEVEVATASREVGNSTKRLVRENEA